MRHSLTLLFFPALALPQSVVAQATSNAITGASDAFGYRSGDEAIGIYDEASARGFNLEAAGNYRFHGTYFVKNGGVSPFFLESTTVRIGYGTLPVPFPSPSGIVDYRLRDPRKDEPSYITVGRDYFGQEYVDVLLKHRAEAAPLSGTIGVSFVPQMTDRQGGEAGGSVLIGGTVRYAPGSTSIQFFGGEYRYEKASQFRLVTHPDLLKRPMKRDRFIGIDGMNDQGQRRTAGLIADAGIGDGFGVGTTTVFTQEDPSWSYLTLLGRSGDDGSVDATTIASPAQRTTSISSEARAYYSADISPTHAHRIDTVARFRRTESRFGGSTIYNIGEVAFDQPIGGDRDDYRPRGTADLNDRIRQVGSGISYRGVIGRARVNAGILRTRFRKTVDGDSISSSKLDTSAWIYNVSGAYDFFQWMTVYGGFSRGMEEAGIAPPSAPNRYEVLPPAKARQFEVSAIFQPSADFKFIVGAFDLQRGYFGADGIGGEYRKLGDVTHRGIEVSGAGTVANGLTAVLGAVVIDPIVESPGDDFRPIGVPKVRAQANVDYEFRSGFHVDGTVQYSSSRPATTKSPVMEESEVPAAWTVNLGFRAPLRLAGLNSTVRFQLANLLNDYSWEVSSSGTMNYNASRSFRLALTTEF